MHLEALFPEAGVDTTSPPPLSEVVSAPFPRVKTFEGVATGERSFDRRGSPRPSRLDNYDEGETGDADVAPVNQRVSWTGLDLGSVRPGFFVPPFARPGPPRGGSGSRERGGQGRGSRGEGGGCLLRLAAAPASSGETAAPKTKSMLRWAIEASGPIGVFLLCLSIYFTALVIRLFMELRLSEAVPPALVEKLGSGHQGQEVPGSSTTPAGQRLVPRPAGPDRRRQPAQRSGRGQGGDERGDRRDRHRHGGEDQLPGDHRHSSGR